MNEKDVPIKNVQTSCAVGAKATDVLFLSVVYNGSVGGEPLLLCGAEVTVEAGKTSSEVR